MANKILQHQPKDKPHTQEKFQGAATSARDAIRTFRGLNLYDGHCNGVREWYNEVVVY